MAFPIDMMRMRNAPSVGPGPELISNGTFGLNSTGWTNTNSSNAVSAGKVTVTTSAAVGGISQSITTVIGATYTVTYDATNGTGTATVSAADTAATTTTLGSGAAATGGSFTFVADATTTFIRLIVQGTSGGKTGTFDNISCKRTA